jgi:AI-2 transport protein TqsA
MDDRTEPEAGQPALARADLRGGLLLALALVAVGAALRAMGPVLIPLIASVFTALAVMPVRDAVRRRVPRALGWLGPVAALLVLLAIVAVFATGLWLAARQLVAEAPVDPARIAEAMAAEEDPASEALAAAEAGAEEARASEDEGGTLAQRPAASEPLLPAFESGNWLSPENLRALAERFGDRALSAAGGVAAAALNAAAAIGAGLVIVLFFTFLILLESGDWKRKTRAATGWRASWTLLESADTIAAKVRSYFLIQGGLGLTTAVLYVGWLWLWEVDLLLVWGAVTLLLTFIPTVGALISGLLPVAYALLTQDFATALAVGAGILVIEQVMGNFVEPRMQGRNIALSPLVILVSLFVWGWLWGIAGALLAVPITVSLVVLGAHVPALRPWALMLTNRTTYEELDAVTGQGDEGEGLSAPPRSAPASSPAPRP